MARKLVFKHGNSKIEIDESLNETFTKVMDGLLPETKEELYRITEELEGEARKRWLVRRKADGTIDLKNTKNSKDKVYSEVVVNSQFELSGRLGNYAEYAWAIRVGGRSETTIPYNRRISNELLYKPMKKESKKLVKILLKETSKMMK